MQSFVPLGDSAWVYKPREITFVSFKVLPLVVANGQKTTLEIQSSVTIKG